MSNFMKIVAQFDSTDHGYDFLVAIEEGFLNDAIDVARKILTNEMVHNRGCNEEETKIYVEKIVNAGDLGINAEELEQDHVFGPEGNDFCSLSFSNYCMGEVMRSSKCDDFD